MKRRTKSCEKARGGCGKAGYCFFKVCRGNQKQKDQKRVPAACKFESGKIKRESRFDIYKLIKLSVIAPFYFALHIQGISMSR